MKIQVIHVNVILIVWGVVGSMVGYYSDLFSEQIIFEEVINWLTVLIPGIENHSSNSKYDIELACLWSFYFITMPILLFFILSYAENLKIDHKRASNIKQKYNLHITAFKKKVILSSAYIAFIVYLFVGIEQRFSSKGILLKLYQSNLVVSFFVTWFLWSAFIYFSLVLKEAFFSDFSD